MFVCVCSVFVLSCVGSGLATGWSLFQGVLSTVYKCKITEPHKEEAKARYGLRRHIRRRMVMMLVIIFKVKHFILALALWDSSVGTFSPRGTEGCLPELTRSVFLEIYVSHSVWRDDKLITGET
jgi:hypothetical protein